MVWPALKERLKIPRLHFLINLAAFRLEVKSQNKEDKIGTNKWFRCKNDTASQFLTFIFFVCRILTRVPHEYLPYFGWSKMVENMCWYCRVSPTFQGCGEMMWKRGKYGNNGSRAGRGGGLRIMIMATTTTESFLNECEYFVRWEIHYQSFVFKLKSRGIKRVYKDSPRPHI